MLVRFILKSSGDPVAWPMHVWSISIDDTVPDDVHDDNSHGSSPSPVRTKSSVLRLKAWDKHSWRTECLIGFDSPEA